MGNGVQVCGVCVWGGGGGDEGGGCVVQTIR